MSDLEDTMAWHTVSIAAGGKSPLTVVCNLLRNKNAHLLPLNKRHVKSTSWIKPLDIAAGDGRYVFLSIDKKHVREEEYNVSFGWRVSVMVGYGGGVRKTDLIDHYRLAAKKLGFDDLVDNSIPINNRKLNAALRVIAKENTLYGEDAEFVLFDSSESERTEEGWEIVHPGALDVRTADRIAILDYKTTNWIDLSYEEGIKRLRRDCKRAAP